MMDDAGPPVVASCKEALKLPNHPSGVYAIDAGDASPVPVFLAYCDMTTANGGWTLVLKVDGSKPTFKHDDNIWENGNFINEAFPDLDKTEAKLQSFVKTPFEQILITMEDNGQRRSMIGDVSIGNAVPSMQSQLAGGGFHAIKAGRARWEGLLESPSLQANCNYEGFNTIGTLVGTMQARIGIVSNEQNDCNTPDSVIGIGAKLGATDWTSGNHACCSSDHGDRNYTMTFSWVLVR